MKAKKKITTEAIPFSKAHKIIKYLLIFITSSLLFILLIILIPEPNYKDGFRNLSELQQYGKTINEYVPMDGQNPLSPSYESYYQIHYQTSLIKKFLKKINLLLIFLKIKAKPQFSTAFFQNLLKEVSNYRISQQQNGLFVQKFDATEKSKIVVFGVVQGAFHSLVRDLEKLKDLNIIDENLKIINKAHYLVFLGGVINRSPYTLEVFSIVLRLMKNNPLNVIYLKGTNEFPEFWRQHTLKRELETRFPLEKISKIPLEKEIDAFFNTLPITLFVTIPYFKKQSLTYLKFSPRINNQEALNWLDENNFVDFLYTKATQENLVSLNASEKNQTQRANKNNIVLKAVVQDILKRDSYEAMDGLRILSSNDKTISWTVLSCPTLLYQNSFGFHHDAFVVITATKEPSNWLITLYNRDVKKQNASTFNTRSYYFFSGEKII